jgi:hypothetical protein
MLVQQVILPLICYALADCTWKALYALQFHASRLLWSNLKLYGTELSLFTGKAIGSVFV